ncbi:MAG: SUMF1/EgtB/PvdO family nonheme iron enzyme [Myxococcales bacterium]|nr:SUMF1/EgtB/PvdO family nonheme iron enzyme [Myxococcales bacterium]
MDGFRLASLIGSGSAGWVYLAHDLLLDRPVAMKIIRGMEDDPFARERFLVEAKAIARLQHPNVVAIYRVGMVGGHPYLASEFVRGEPLDRLPTPLPAERVLLIAIGLARGLAAAHRRGVLHRDVKPANAILTGDAEVKLVDFGLATLLADSPGGPSAELPARRRRPPARAGPLVGTPAYIAPEVWRGEPASFRTDVYSLGALLYHLCAGQPPHQGESLDDLRRSVTTRESEPPGGAGPGLSGIIRRCLRIDPELRFGSADEVRDALEALTPERRMAVLPPGNPYRGLLAFEAEHRAVFFGRDSEVRAVVDRLRFEPFVLVAGASGVGKSSLCRAGVLPRVVSGALDSRSWTVAALTPGKRPLASLAAALARWFGAHEEELLSCLTSSPKATCRELRQRCRVAGPLLLFVDQLEELVTLGEPDQAAAFAELIEELAGTPGDLRLLCTARGDFLARLAGVPGLADELSRGLYLLPPMSEASVREVVVGPARAKGITFESEALVATLVESGCSAEGALPILQFALAELWNSRDVPRGTITISSLDALGGVTGALARHADGVLSHLPAPQRAAARRLLPLMVTLEGTRARRTEAELSFGDENGRAALAALVRGRLVTARESPGGSAYEVAHEALIRSWPTLGAWLEEDAERRQTYERLSGAVAEWERLGRRREALWGRSQLAEAAKLEREGLGPKEKSFLDASRRADRRRRWVVVGAGLGVVLAVMGGALATRARARAEQATRARALAAEGQRLIGEAAEKVRSAEALRLQAFGHFDSGRSEEGEREWGQSLVERSGAEAHLARACRSLESALLLGGGRPARELLADALEARALLAGEERRLDDRDELLARLSLYDGRGRLAKWSRPAALTVRTDPPGGRVQLSRFVPKGGRLEEERLGEMEGERPEAAGSFAVTASAPGRATVRLPFVLRPGERRELLLPVPEASFIPDGFVYVPPGELLFGSGAEEGLRRDFFRTVPLHAISTGGYLIARHETTFAEWTAFLDSLPSPERARRAPGLGTGGFRGALALDRLGEKWRLAVHLGGARREAVEGEPILLPDRRVRSALDWRRLPVVGISSEDAQAYFDWLRRSGKVPGARFCTEHEWERAARGADGREYPHGDRLEPEDIAYDETYGKAPAAMGPDEVGSHPSSASPFGVDDLSGNVWEWVRSSLPDGAHVVRGGGWSYGSNSARASNREVVEPSLRDLGVGLRVCADLART